MILKSWLLGSIVLKPGRTGQDFVYFLSCKGRGLCAMILRKYSEGRHGQIEGGLSSAAFYLFYGKIPPVK